MKTECIWKEINTVTTVSEFYKDIPDPELPPEFHVTRGPAKLIANSGAALACTVLHTHWHTALTGNHRHSG
jgi:hypothetical protein